MGEQYEEGLPLISVSDTSQAGYNSGSVRTRGGASAEGKKEGEQRHARPG